MRASWPNVELSAVNRPKENQKGMEAKAVNLHRGSNKGYLHFSNVSRRITLAVTP